VKGIGTAGHRDNGFGPSTFEELRLQTQDRPRNRKRRPLESFNGLPDTCIRRAGHFQNNQTFIYTSVHVCDANKLVVLAARLL